MEYRHTGKRKQENTQIEFLFIFYFTPSLILLSSYLSSATRFILTPFPIHLFLALSSLPQPSFLLSLSLPSSDPCSHILLLDRLARATATRGIKTCYNSFDISRILCSYRGRRRGGQNGEGERYEGSACRVGEREQDGDQSRKE